MHLEVRRRRRAMPAVDRRLDAPLDQLVADLGDHDEVAELAVVDAHERADLEAARRWTCASPAPMSRSRVSSACAPGACTTAEPDRVAPRAFVERADLERRLVPVVDLHVLGARGVSARQLALAAACATRTTQQSVPPFLKKPCTESAVYSSRPYRTISTNSSQFARRVGSFIGPPSRCPTNPVMRVSAIAIGGGTADSFGARVRVDRRRPHLRPPRVVDLAVDARDLAEPDVTFFVLHVEDVVDGPVEVVRDVTRSPGTAARADR